MKEGDRIQYINNQNEVSKEICELVELDGDFCRIKRPNGQIIRIFNDRVKPIATEEGPSVDNKIDWSELPGNGEVWVKSNRFNETTVCETIAIIDPESDSYKSINTYNGKAQKVMVYPMKNYNLLVKRMIRKGYEKKKNK